MQINILFAILLLSACTSNLESNKSNSAVSHDGRFDTKCSSRAGDIKGSFCRISIYQLISNVERYDRKRVEFLGIIAHVENRYLIFPTEEAYHRLDISSAIEIEENPKRILGWAAVNGSFSAGFDGRSDKYIGRISHSKIYPR